MNVTFWSRPAECYRHNCTGMPAFTLEWIGYSEDRYDTACLRHANMSQSWANLRSLGVLKKGDI